jgi:bifunctional DNase/RNase
LIEMSLVGVRVELPTNQPIVLLREADGERYLPIWIGSVEAQAIAFALQGMTTPRPLTHDLMRDLLSTLGTEVRRVTIAELRDGTFYADILLATDAGEATVSARPSDAIALAVRMGTPIWAEDAVLDEASILIREEDEEDEEVEKFREFLEDISPEDFS